MKEPVLTRIDYRLIHGQVSTLWVPEVHANHIVVIDDASCNNSMLKMVLEMAKPRQCSLEVVTAEMAGKMWANGDFDNKGNVIALFKDTYNALNAYKAGFEYKTLQVGNMVGAANKKKVLDVIYMDEKDARNIDEIAKSGVNVYLKILPESGQESWNNAKSKAFPNL